jgi:tyrosyl-tRNA synthetase
VSSGFKPELTGGAVIIAFPKGSWRVKVSALKTWNMSKTITDEKKIDELLSRSVDTIYPTKEGLRGRLLSGERLRVYMGIDPTNTYAHLGHSTNYIVLKRFHELGHQVTVLIGDFTAMIGDPSDKSAARVRLTKEQVKDNTKTFKEQIGKILDFNNEKNPIEFRFNAEWLSRIDFEMAVDLASNFTVQQMLERDVFERRIKEEKPLYVHEFFYPLMQGYDSVALETDVEVGGTDQTFNMLAGRTLVKRYQKREKFVLTTTLLEDPKTGKKLMSKSEGTGVALDSEPNDMYGKAMALPDSGVIQCFIDCTYLSMEEINLLKKAEGADPKDLKMKLAREIVSMYHGEKEALKAEEDFIETFQKGGIPEEVEVVKAKKGDLLQDVIVWAKLVESNSQFNRLIDQKAIKVVGDGEVAIDDNKYKIDEPLTIKIGKKRILRNEV